jgi:hypothetical protein
MGNICGGQKLEPEIEVIIKSIISFYKSSRRLLSQKQSLFG